MLKLTLVLVGALLTMAVASAQAAVTTNDKTVTFALDEFVPCANGGVGEVVSGEVLLHALITATVNNNQTSGKFHFQPQGGTAIGETSGDTYHATGVTQDSFSGSLQNGKFTETFVNNFRLIGVGPRNNLLLHTTAHITVNASGETTVEFDKSTEECR